MSALFADLAGSTALGEQFDRGATRALLTYYCAVLRAIFERQCGTVEKLTGDAITAARSKSIGSGGLVGELEAVALTRCWIASALVR